MAPCGPGATRFVGGYQSLADGLKADSTANVELGCQVTSIKQGGAAGIQVTCERADGTVNFSANRVVVAIPPAVLALSVTFSPPVPPVQLRKMSSTATWCGDWCKVVANFDTAFLLV